MGLISSKAENDSFIIFLSGRIDSANASAVEADINEAKAGYTGTKLILDADNLEYISSAGLRVILRIRKEYAELKIVNVSSEVYEIFEMTGFTEMLPIEKAYRKFSVEGCEQIGRGSNGEVFRLNPDTIIKVYFNPEALPDIQNERELAKRAFVLGIPTAIPYDIVRVGNTYGSVFELLSAKSFAQILAAEPDKMDFVVKEYVDLMKKIHSTEVKTNDMPSIKKVVRGWVGFLEKYMDADKYQKLASLVDNAPDPHTMIHGDYHIGNVMLQDGEVMLIDMDTLSWGAPIFELASVFNAYIGFTAFGMKVDHTFLKITLEQAKELYERSLKLYFEGKDEAYIEDVKNKAALIGYTRLWRRTIKREPDQPEKIEFYKQQVLSLLDKVDTLDI